VVAWSPSVAVRHGGFTYGIDTVGPRGSYTWYRTGMHMHTYKLKLRDVVTVFRI
jgi:hypothetical protein